jgi:putative heme-binding domain-containing protein
MSIRNQNIRFDPRSGEFTLTSGGGQHGLTFDDWGDTFTCDNANPIQHLVYDSRYVARNAYVEAPAPLLNLYDTDQRPKLFRISPPEPWRQVRTRLRVEKRFDGPDEGGEPFGFFTGATGVTVYRGDAWPAEFRGNVFVGDVANNLVFRARLKENGVGWKAERADADREFLASSDIWFRPVQFANGPDGALYVVDMYRELIETIESMPTALLQHVDVAGGINRGRIYRIVPKEFVHRKPPRLSEAATSELVGLLEYENCWHRETAARLIYQRQDNSAVEGLRGLAGGSSSGRARMHARYALAGLRELHRDDVIAALHDPEPRAREHALRLAEDFPGDALVRRKMLAMTGDTEERVRLQLAFSLGAIGSDEAANGLAQLARQAHSNPLVEMAILSSAGECRIALLERLNDSRGRPMIDAVARQILRVQRADELDRLGRVLDALPAGEEELLGKIAKIAAGLPREAHIPGQHLPAALRAIIAQALGDASGENAEQALRLLGRAKLAEIEPIVARYLRATQPAAVQVAALELLGRFDDSRVPMIVVSAWTGMSPAVRASAAETLLTRKAWIPSLLEAVDVGRIRPAELDPVHVQRLVNSRDSAIAARAAKLFQSSRLSPRREVLAKYQAALEQRGDAGKGKVAFEKHCSTCHRLDGIGTNVGADLATLRNGSADKALVDILDPNREVLAKFYAYQVTTKAGVTVTGVITSENANSVALRRNDGTTMSIARVDIGELTSTGISAMPEGLEQQIDISSMADLLAFLIQGMR